MNPTTQLQSPSPSATQFSLGSIVRLCAITALTLASATGARAQTANQKWVGTWAVSPVTQEGFGGRAPAAPPSFTNVTLRQVVHTSIGGTGVRVRVSNTFGMGDLVIGAAHIAYRGANSEIRGGTDSVLTFNGRTSVTIPAGALLVSDPISDFAVPALGDLAISIYLPNTTAGNTLHSLGRQTNYVLAGDQSGALQPTVSSTQQIYYFLTNVETIVPKNTRGIVTFGDSVTDGDRSTPDTNSRWPNFLAQRLLRKGGGNHLHDAGIMNQGIAGNRVLHNVFGPAALSRFDRDVSAQPGVTDVILFEAINDIGFANFLPNETVSADDIMAGYRQIIARAHAAGLRIFGVTMTPFAGSSAFSDAGEVKRLTVNNFVRTSGEFDGVIDFDAVLSDNQTPAHVQAQFDSDDHLHPNDAGYQAVANAIPLKFFKQQP